MVWYGMVWYGMVWYGMVWYGMVQHDMVWRDPPSVWASFQPPTQHRVPERSIFSTIYGTFNSARELMRPYMFYMAGTLCRIMACYWPSYTQFHSYLRTKSHAMRAIYIIRQKHHSSPHFSLFKDQIPAGGHFFDLKFKLYLNDGEPTSLFYLPVILFYLPVIDS